MTGRAPQAVAEEARPVIEITTARHSVVDQALAAVREDPQIYQRAGELVHVVDAPEDDDEGRTVATPAGTPRIAELPASVLGLRLTAAAGWTKFDARSESMVKAHPPDWAIRSLHELGTWPGIRYLEAVVEAPVLRPDGTVLDRPGYDATTGLLYLPSAQFLPVPEVPTQWQANEALRELEHVVVDFPFEEPVHRAAWLASLLTPMARHAFQGPAPLFSIEANTRGSGKSKLVDIVTNISTGRDAARTPHEEDETEVKKAITSLAFEGIGVVLIDNVERELHSRALEAVLTGTVWRDRKLGQSATVEVKLKTVWYASGNNFTLRGDLGRRALPVRLLSPEARPEERQDFTHPNLLEWVREHRPSLVRAVLVVLRGYCAAGRPKVGLKKWGSFEGWSDLVRNALVWAGAADPLGARLRLVDEDPEVALLTRLLDGLEDLRPGAHGFSLSEILRARALDESAPPQRHEELWEVLDDMAPQRMGVTNKRSLGQQLKLLVGRVLPDGRSLGQKYDEHSKVQRWRVDLRGSAGKGGDGAYASDQTCMPFSPVLIPASPLNPAEPRKEEAEATNEVIKHTLCQTKSSPTPSSVGFNT